MLDAQLSFPSFVRAVWLDYVEIPLPHAVHGRLGLFVALLHLLWRIKRDLDCIIYSWLSLIDVMHLALRRGQRAATCHPVIELSVIFGRLQAALRIAAVLCVLSIAAAQPFLPGQGVVPLGEAQRLPHRGITNSSQCPNAGMHFTFGTSSSNVTCISQEPGGRPMLVAPTISACCPPKLTRLLMEQQPVQTTQISI